MEQYIWISRKGIETQAVIEFKDEIFKCLTEKWPHLIKPMQKVKF